MQSLNAMKRNIRLEVADNCFLRPIFAEDVTQPYVDGLNDSVVNQYLVTSRKEMQTVESVREYVQLNSTSEVDVLFGVFIDGELRGTIRLHDIDRDDGSARIGFLIFDVNYWRKGWATKAIASVISFASKVSSISRFRAGMVAKNTGSQKTLAGLGFVYCPELDWIDEDQVEHHFWMLEQRPQRGETPQPDPNSSRAGQTAMTRPVDSFESLWKERPVEANYIHWTREAPQNQIQLAFRRHWMLFREIMGSDFQGRRVLELGCGRGSISAYFADAGFDCTLMDISPEVIERARRIFHQNKLNARFEVGDAYRTRLADRSFDVVVSIGLLEHLEDLGRALGEQIRLLDHDGLLLAYVVPENPNNIQKDYSYICEVIALYDRALNGDRTTSQKPPVYRSDAGSRHYLDLLSQLPTRDVTASGVYPLPMVSPSVTFPFTLMPAPMELALTHSFEKILAERALVTGRNPWLCDESVGQAFLVWGWRK